MVDNGRMIPKFRIQVQILLFTNLTLDRKPQNQ